VPEGEFDFLGYTFGRMYKRTTGPVYVGVRPSKKSIRRMVAKIHAMTSVSGIGQATTELVKQLNRTLRGWANYLKVGTTRGAYRALDQYTAVRYVGGCGASTISGESAAGAIPSRTCTGTSDSYAWCNLAVARRGCRRDVLSESRMREICKSCSMSGMWKRSHGPGNWAPPDERGGNRQPEPTITAPHPDSTNTSCTSTVLSCAPPVIPGSNDWDLNYELHIEQITIDAD